MNWSPDGCCCVDWIWIWILLLLARMDPLAKIGMDRGNWRVSGGGGDPAQTHHGILISTISIRCDLSFNCLRLKLWGKREGYWTASQEENLCKETWCKLPKIWRKGKGGKIRLNCWWWRGCIVVALHELPFNAVSLPCILSNHPTINAKISPFYHQYHTIPSHHQCNPTILSSIPFNHPYHAMLCIIPNIHAT